MYYFLGAETETLQICRLQQLSFVKIDQFSNLSSQDYYFYGI